MWIRAAQIVGLLLCVLGWGSVGITLGMDRWRVAQLGGRGGSSVVETSWFWSDLWKDCYQDSSALVNCVDFGVLWNVKPYIQAVRGLLLSGLCLGLVATTLMFFGMECTRIGGGQTSKNRLLTTASALHALGCVSDVAGFCLYVNTVAAAFLHSKADPSTLSYEVGAPLYVGLLGCFVILLGCSVQCAAACTVQLQHSRRVDDLPITEKEEGSIRRQKHSHGASKSSNISLYKPASVVIV